MGLTSRQRVRKALTHQEPDLVPIDFGAMRSTGISAIAYNKLKEYLGIRSGFTKMYDVFQQLAEPEEEIMNIMGADVIQLHRYQPAFGISLEGWKSWQLPDGSDCLVPEDFNPVENEEGDLEIRDGDTVIAKMPAGGIYFDSVYHPLADVKSKNEIDNIDFPEITDSELAYLEKEARRLYKETDYAILGEFGGNIFEAGQGDWGFERYYLELGLNTDLIDYYHGKLVEAHLKNLKKYLEAVGEYIDVIQFGDDLGTQEAPQISREMYYRLIKPYHSQQYQYVKDNYPDVKVFLHSCGSIYDLIPELIDAGVQILNPVQLSARNMDAKTLKQEFGNDLVFWGGGSNTQTTVTSGSVSEIKEEVKELIDIFAPGGGFVFTQVHNIQADIEPEKVMAIYETAKAHRKYEE